MEENKTPEITVSIRLEQVEPTPIRKVPETCHRVGQKFVINGELAGKVYVEVTDEDVNLYVEDTKNKKLYKANSWIWHNIWRAFFERR